MGVYSAKCISTSTNAVQIVLFKSSCCCASGCNEPNAQVGVCLWVCASNIAVLQIWHTSTDSRQCRFTNPTMRLEAYDMCFHTLIKCGRSVPPLLSTPTVLAESRTSLSVDALAMQVLRGVTIFFDGLGADDGLEQLQQTACLFGAACSSTGFTHIVGLHFSERASTASEPKAQGFFPIVWHHHVAMLHGLKGSLLASGSYQHTFPSSASLCELLPWYHALLTHYKLQESHDVLRMTSSKMLPATAVIGVLTANVCLAQLSA